MWCVIFHGGEPLATAVVSPDDLTVKVASASVGSDPLISLFALRLSVHVTATTSPAVTAVGPRVKTRLWPVRIADPCRIAENRAPVFVVAVHAVRPSPVNGVPVVPSMVIVPSAAIADVDVNWKTAGPAGRRAMYDAGVAVTPVTALAAALPTAARARIVLVKHFISVAGAAREGDDAGGEKRIRDG